MACCAHPGQNAFCQTVTKQNFTGFAVLSMDFLPQRAPHPRPTLPRQATAFCHSQVRHHRQPRPAARFPSASGPDTVQAAARSRHAYVHNAASPPGTAKPAVRLPVMMARQRRLSHIPAPAPGRPRPSAGAGIFRHPDKPAAQISATVHCWRLPAGHSQTICPAQPRAGRTAAVAPAPGGNSPRAPAQTVRFPQAGAGLQTCPASRRRPPRFWRSSSSSAPAPRTDNHHDASISAVIGTCPAPLARTPERTYLQPGCARFLSAPSPPCPLTAGAGLSPAAAPDSPNLSLSPRGSLFPFCTTRGTLKAFPPITGPAPSAGTGRRPPAPCREQGSHRLCPVKRLRVETQGVLLWHYQVTRSECWSSPSAVRSRWPVLR